MPNDMFPFQHSDVARAAASVLETLDTIDWSSLTHARGPAGDVPDLLRGLASADRDMRLEALAWKSEVRSTKLETNPNSE